MAAEPETPQHPLYALATFELTSYRRELEQAIAFFGRQSPVPPAEAGLRKKLEEVLDEEESRNKAASHRA